MNPRSQIVNVAKLWLGKTEATKNYFDGIEQLWAATSYPDGHKHREPYCAAFVCYCVREAGKADARLKLALRPTSAAVSGWKEWARKGLAGVYLFGPTHNVAKPQPGDIVSFLPRLSHIGIVESYDPDTKTVHTIEANTDGEGSREGDGIYRKKRALSFCGEFYRLPVKAVKA